MCNASRGWYWQRVTNVGSQTLEITNVQTSCGCTTANDWSRSVEPGKTGTIPIQFNSANFSGQVSKSITVTCNDPSQPQFPIIKVPVRQPPRPGPTAAPGRVLPPTPPQAAAQ